MDVSIDLLGLGIYVFLSLVLTVAFILRMYSFAFLKGYRKANTDTAEFLQKFKIEHEADIRFQIERAFTKYEREQGAKKN